MSKNLRWLLLSLVLFVASSVLLSACKKKSEEQPQPDTVANLKSVVTGKWQLVKGITTEYDANGQVISSEDLSGTTPIPEYDFRANDRLYLKDYRGEKEFSYELSFNEGRPRILLNDSEYYDIISVNKTDMKWVRDLKARDDQQGDVRRAVTEVEFKKL